MEFKGFAPCPFLAPFIVEVSIHVFMLNFQTNQSYTITHPITRGEMHEELKTEEPMKVAMKHSDPEKEQLACRGVKSAQNMKYR